MPDQLLVLTTHPEHQGAVDLAAQLVQRRLAACVNVLPLMTSVYEWKGELQKGHEHLLLIKTTPECYPAVETSIRELHPYELPEVVATPITRGLKDYLAWVTQQTMSTEE